MNTSLARRLTSLAIAAVLTLGTLLGIDGLATGQLSASLPASADTTQTG
jgi:hypothetical protein